MDCEVFACQHNDGNGHCKEYCSRYISMNADGICNNLTVPMVLEAGPAAQPLTWSQIRENIIGKAKVTDTPDGGINVSVKTDRLVDELYYTMHIPRDIFGNTDADDKFESFMKKLKGEQNV